MATRLRLATPSAPHTGGDHLKALTLAILALLATPLFLVGMSKKGPKDPLVNVFEWTHKHFPNFLDCRPIYVRRALEEAGFSIRKAVTKHMWIPVGIVLGVKSIAHVLVS